MPSPNTAPRTFTARHVVELDAAVPEWVELIPAGEFSGRDGRGPYRLNAAAVQLAFANWGMPLVIDYEHQAFNAPKNGQPAPAAGWVTSLDVRDGALWGRVEWTAQAAAWIGTRAYRYLSPVFDFDKSGTVVRVLGAGLTNNPNLYLTALNRREDSPSTHRGSAMDELIERLRYMLNLPVTSTPEEISGHLQRLIDAINAPQTAEMRAQLALAETAGIAELLTAAHGRLTAAPDPQRYVAIAEYQRATHALRSAEETTRSLQARLDQIEAERRAEQVEHDVSAALAAGKIIPAEADWARAYCTRDREGFSAFVAATPARVALGDVATAQRAAGDAADLDDTNSIVRAAHKYQDEQKAAGNPVSYELAVQAVTQQLKGAQA